VHILHRLFEIPCAPLRLTLSSFRVVWWLRLLAQHAAPARRARGGATVELEESDGGGAPATVLAQAVYGTGTMAMVPTVLPLRCSE
jgi:hypothetical protein